MARDRRSLAAILLALAAAAGRADTLVTESAAFDLDVSPVDGRIAIDLAGSIWVLPARGGEAQLLSNGSGTASRPRWSPDGSKILFETRSASGSQLWILDLESANTERVADAGFHNQHGDWHPGGERIVYASQRGDSGLDIWETDLPTGLSWRLTSLPGDETEPVWSANGRHLAYLHENGPPTELVLRRFGEPDRPVASSDGNLLAPSWRPDGSLLTFIRDDENGLRAEMAILSDPVLVRTLVGGETLVPTPLSWLDRMRFVYVADGNIRSRGFEDRRSRMLPFRAFVPNEPVVAPRTVHRRTLPLVDAPRSRFVVRAAQLFDGVYAGYRRNMDIVIENGRVSAIEAARARPDDVLLDLGDTTVFTGFIDAWSALPAELSPAHGAAILAFGVTTLVTADLPSDFAPHTWEQEATPGPRLLAATPVDATVDRPRDFYLAVMPEEPQTVDELSAQVEPWHEAGVPVLATTPARRYWPLADVLLATAYTDDATPVSDKPSVSVSVLLSGLADSGTPDIERLLESRQVSELGFAPRPARRLAALPRLTTLGARIVAGSRPNGLPAGLALHAELAALAAAGLDAEQVLKAAGQNPAAALGIDNQVGTLVPGSLADLVLVSGDPLARPSDSIRVVAVVRNGRFYSVASLLERATPASSVE